MKNIGTEWQYEHKLYHDIISYLVDFEIIEVDIILPLKHMETDIIIVGVEADQVCEHDDA
jgi:hypothetical protein